MNGIHNIKGKTSVNILVSNYTNKHITFNKGEYIGHLEPTIDKIPQTTETPDAPTMHSITTDSRNGRSRHFQTIPSLAKETY